MRTIEAIVNSSNSSFLIPAPLKIEGDTKEVYITFIVYLAPQSQALYSLHFLAKRLPEQDRTNKKRAQREKFRSGVIVWRFSQLIKFFIALLSRKRAAKLRVSERVKACLRTKRVPPSLYIVNV